MSIFGNKKAEEAALAIKGNKTILDPACGSRMMYIDRADKRVLFGDCRNLDTTLCDGRKLIVNPNIILDFRKLPFEDNRFSMVVFDPPHLLKCGNKSWLALKYGKLSENWRDDMRKGFAECFRVLKPEGSLIFKWGERDIKLEEILRLTPEKPVIADRGRGKDTHWIVFLKG